MSHLRNTLADYLTMRRALGYTYPKGPNPFRYA